MGSVESRLQSDRASVFKSRQEIIEHGNRLVSTINIDRLFHNDICSRLAYVYANKLKGFRNEILDNVATSIGLKIPDKESYKKQKELLCQKIVEFFMLKVDIISEAFSDIGYCERIEEEIFRGVNMREVCSKRPGEDFKCCSDGTWKRISEECLEGYESNTQAMSVLNELRTFNKKINRSYKDINIAVQEVINSETIQSLRNAQLKLDTLIEDSRRMCDGEWNRMSKFIDPKSPWLPENYVKVRRYDHTSKDLNIENFNLKKGTVVEIIKVSENNILVRIPAYCEDETKCLLALPRNSLSNRYISETEEISNLKGVLSTLMTIEPGSKETDNFDL